jgi:hypothetical protein
MALEYRLTLAGPVPMDEVAARAFPDPADRPAPDDESGEILAANLHDRYGIVVIISTYERSYYSAAAEAGQWEWEPEISVDLAFEMTKDADRFAVALRHAITASARVLATGTEDAALMLSGDMLLLTRHNGVITKHERGWWEHHTWANEIIPS